MTRYHAARVLASMVVWLGFLILGMGLVALAVSLPMAIPGGVVSLYGIAVGILVALFGFLCRAVFDIADAVRPAQPLAAPAPSVAIPLQVNDPG